MCGKPFADRIFSRLGCTVTWHVNEGDYIDASKGKISVRSFSLPSLSFQRHFTPSLALLSILSGT